MKRFLCNIYVWTVIFSSSYNRRIEIEHDLNRWQWPFKFFKKWFLSKPDYLPKTGDTKNNFMNKFFIFIKNRTTEYDRLYYHNVTHRNTMTPAEFDTWFYKERNDPELMINAFKVLNQIYERDKIRCN